MRQAARATRAAAEKVRKAMANLRACADAWDDLDEMARGDLDALPELPAEVASIIGDINELYPAKKRWH